MSNKWEELEKEETQEDIARLGRGILGSIVTTALGVVLGGPIGGAIAGVSTLVKTGTDIDKRQRERNQGE